MRSFDTVASHAGGPAQTDGTQYTACAQTEPIGCLLPTDFDYGIGLRVVFCMIAGTRSQGEFSLYKKF